MTALLATLLLGQLVVIPSNETDGAAVVISEQTGMWWIFTGQLNDNGFVFDVLKPTREFENGKVAVLSGPPGQYVVMQQYQKPDGSWDWWKAKIVIRGQPDDDDNPPPPPPPPGKRKIVILYESEDNTPGFKLACQEVQKYCLQKTHEYFAFDKDSVSPDGQQPAWLLKYLSVLRSANVEMPGMLVIAEKQGQEYASPVAFPATGKLAIDKIKELGG